MREELRKLYGKHRGFTATIGDKGIDLNKELGLKTA